MPARNKLKSRKIVTLALVLAACLMFPQVVSAWYPPIPGGGNNYAHELMVYSIEYYGQHPDSSVGGILRNWKTDIPFYNVKKNPYVTFWDYMYTYCSNQSFCAKKDDSVRRLNNLVTVDSMVSMDNGWQDADMVFFFGHNVQIAPQNSPHMEHDHNFGIWLPDNGTWHTGAIGGFDGDFDFNDWGTSNEPYRYHRNLVDDASYSNAYAVFYAYNPLTSVLIGEDFSSGYWYTENIWNQSIQDPHFGELAHDTEWIIAHGCSGVQTASYYHYGAIDDCTRNSDCAVINAIDTCHGEVGDLPPLPPLNPQPDYVSGNVIDDGVCHRPVSSYLGVHAWDKSWGRLHTVLGHWAGTTTQNEPRLDAFASALMADNAVVKDAYFDVHTNLNIKNWMINRYGRGWAQPAAISVSMYDCCYWDGIFFICPTGGCSGDYMNSETWNSPMSDDIVTDLHYYSTAYNVFMPVYEFLPITSSAAIRMLGTDTIEKRPDSFQLEQTKLSYIHA